VPDLIKVVYLYNLKEGVDHKEFESYYFKERIAQVMKVPNLDKFCFSIAVQSETSRYRYMAECFYKDLKTAKQTLDSTYFKDVHGYITGKLVDMEVMFLETHEWHPSEQLK
jgi:EthD protein.